MKINWITNRKNNYEEPAAHTQPVQMIFVDQLLSPMPWFIFQIKGILTTKKYKYVTVFVDNYSRFTYTHSKETDMSYETIEDKISFERIYK